MLAITAAAALLASRMVMAVPVPDADTVPHQSVPKRPGNSKRSIDIDFPAPYSPLAGPSSQVTVSYRPIVTDAMRTMTHANFQSATIENNAMYQAQLRLIRAAHDSHLHRDATHYKGDVQSFQRIADREAEEANIAYTSVCTAKVMADLDDINAYHRGEVVDADLAFHNAISSNDSHQTNIFALRRARQQAHALRIYSAEEMVLSAEEECAGQLFKQLQWNNERIAAVAQGNSFDFDLLD